MTTPPLVPLRPVVAKHVPAPPLPAVRGPSRLAGHGSAAGARTSPRAPETGPVLVVSSSVTAPGQPAAPLQQHDRYQDG